MLYLPRKGWLNGRVGWGGGRDRAGSLPSTLFIGESGRLTTGVGVLLFLTPNKHRGEGGGIKGGCEWGGLECVSGRAEKVWGSVLGSNASLGRVEPRELERWRAGLVGP